MQTENKLMYSAHKNKSLSATLPGNGARKVLDNPQVQGIVVAPINVWKYGVSNSMSKKVKLFTLYN